MTDIQFKAHLTAMLLPVAIHNAEKEILRYSGTYRTAPATPASCIKDASLLAEQIIK